MLTKFRKIAVLAAIALHGLTAMAQVGLRELAGAPGDGPITVFYPSSSSAAPSSSRTARAPAGRPARLPAR